MTREQLLKLNAWLAFLAGVAAVAANELLPALAAHTINADDEPI
jgi:hypothetical protein